MFTKEYSLRYGDLDSRGEIKISTVLDVLQDISILHSYSVGYSLDVLYSRSLAWLLHGWRIRFFQPIKYGKDAVVKTGITNYNKFEAIRKYEIWQDGICKVTATAEWFTVDTNRMRLTKVPEDIRNAYECTEEEDNGLPFIKLRGNSEIPVISDMMVQNRDIDTNNHMNNVKSVEVLLDFISDRTHISELMITYKKELHKGEIVKICVKEKENGYLGELRNADNEPCVLINVKTDL